MFQITQLVMVLFAYSFASFQEAIVKERLMYVPPYGNRYDKDFHGYGFAVAASISLMGALTIMPDWRWAMGNFFVNGLCYSLVFDLIIGIGVYNNAFYLGTSSKLDRLWKNGKVKALILSIVIAGINVLKYIL